MIWYYVSSLEEGSGYKGTLHLGTDLNKASFPVNVKVGALPCKVRCAGIYSIITETFLSNNLNVTKGVSEFVGMGGYT